MAPISAKAHGIVDYAAGVAMLAAPSALRIADRRAAALLRGAGAGTIAASAVSDHEASPLRRLPMPAHLLLDIGAGVALMSVGWATRRRRAEAHSWVPHAAFGIAEVAVAALTERSPARAAVPEAPAGPERPPAGLSDAELRAWEARLPPDPDQLQAGPDDETLVAREASAAAAEAAMIGGVVPPEVDDPALGPVYQAGGGEQDGWEAAEAELIENATHGEGGGDPLRDAAAPEVESDRSGAVYGEGDRIVSTELVADPGAGEDGPGAGPGLAAEREPRQGPGPDA